MSIYHEEDGVLRPPTAFTEFAGGILDSYYLRIKQAERDVEYLRDQIRSLENKNSRLMEEGEKWVDMAETQKENFGRAERKANQLQDQLNDKAAEIAKRDKVIEQYAAWRVAVREAFNDLPAGYAADNSVLAILSRIVDLTNTMEEETSDDRL